MTYDEWNKKVAHFEDFFLAWELPRGKIKLGAYTIHDVKQYTEVCLSSVRGKEPSVWKETNFSRMRNLEQYLRENE